LRIRHKPILSFTFKTSKQLQDGIKLRRRATKQISKMTFLYNSKSLTKWQFILQND
jgi:hypothetical protein